MVMNGEIAWLEIYKVWLQKQTDYYAAQKTLDDTMSLYLEAKGQPPALQVLKNVQDLRHQMFEARIAVDEFIASHAMEDREKRNLPRHE
jgi:hypothetical protein